MNLDCTAMDCTLSCHFQKTIKPLSEISVALASLVKVKTNVPAAFFLIKEGFTSAFYDAVNATFETKFWI